MLHQSFTIIVYVLSCHSCFGHPTYSMSSSIANAGAALTMSNEMEEEEVIFQFGISGQKLPFAIEQLAKF